MGGNYPDVPGHRFAYDRDGSVAVFIPAVGAPRQLTTAECVALNDETDSSPWGGSGIGNANETNRLAVIFPEIRDLAGVYWMARLISADQPTSCVVQTSPNTTNGVDGTWTTVTTISGLTPKGVPVNPDYRKSIQSAAALSIRAVRFNVTGGGGVFDANQRFGPAAMHIYGTRDPSSNTDRLELWHPTTDAPLAGAYFDWNDVPRGTTATKQFRVKNRSSALTANSVRVAMEALTDSTPSMIGQHSLSTDGSTYASQVNVGTLAPGQISGLVTLKRTIIPTAAFSLATLRVFSEALSWT